MEAYSGLAKAYNELMADVDYGAWAAYIHSLIGKSGARIYETACGTGSVTMRLYDLGHEIVASDISDGMLRVAADLARRSGRGITFVRQDMRVLEAGRKADAVVCACDGVNYVDAEGLSRFARSAFNALRDGGLLLFDVSTAEKLESMDGQVYFDDSDDVSCVWHCAFDARSRTLNMDVTVFARRGDLFERFCETHVQHAHGLEDVRRAVAQAGFGAVDVYEFPTRDACRAGAQRAQFVCRK